MDVVEVVAGRPEDETVSLNVACGLLSSEDRRARLPLTQTQRNLESRRRANPSIVMVYQGAIAL